MYVQSPSLWTSKDRDWVILKLWRLVDKHTLFCYFSGLRTLLRILEWTIEISVHKKKKRHNCETTVVYLLFASIGFTLKEKTLRRFQHPYIVEGSKGLTLQELWPDHTAVCCDQRHPCLLRGRKLSTSEYYIIRNHVAWFSVSKANAKPANKNIKNCTSSLSQGVFLISLRNSHTVYLG